MNVSVISRCECYFSLKRKVTKSSRLHRLHCYGERLRCRLRTRFAQTAQPPDASSFPFADAHPPKAFRRTRNVLWGWPIPTPLQQAVSAILRGSGASLERHQLASVKRSSRSERPEHPLFERSEFGGDSKRRMRSSEPGAALIF